MKKTLTRLTRLGLGLLAAAFAQATPFDHPNYRIALPGLVVGEIAQFNTDEISRQNPQYDVFVTGGLVGLFSRVPYIPVWTTLDVGWEVREVPYYERWGQFGTGTGNDRNLPAPPNAILPQVPEPPSVVVLPKPPSVVVLPEPPSVVVLPEPPSVVVVPELSSDLPEPSSQLMSLMGLALVGLAWKFR